MTLDTYKNKIRRASTIKDNNSNEIMNHDSINNIVNVKSKMNEASKELKNKKSEKPKLKKEIKKIVKKEDKIQTQLNVNITPVKLENNINNSLINDKNINCRICLDGEDINKGKLISPCKCMGSVKFIHENCLKFWVLNNQRVVLKKLSCELCNCKYLVTYSSEIQVTRKRLCKYIEKIVTVLIVSVIIFSSGGYIIYLIVCG